MDQQEERDRRDKEIIEKTRRRIKDGRFQDCPCKSATCSRVGNCTECIVIHRTNRKTLPACIRDIADRKPDEVSGGKS
jgi:hypothetical protein